MKLTLDSVFKVGFGVDLNTLSGLNEFGNRFIKAFDDSNAIVFWRYVDLTWRIKRFLNIGMEASLKKNLNVINDFIFDLVHRKREQMKNETLDVSNFFFCLSLSATFCSFELIDHIFMSTVCKRRYTVKVFDGKCKGSREHD